MVVELSTQIALEDCQVNGEPDRLKHVVKDRTRSRYRLPLRQFLQHQHGHAFVAVGHQMIDEACGPTPNIDHGGPGCGACRLQHLHRHSWSLLEPGEVLRLLLGVNPLPMCLAIHLVVQRMGAVNSPLHSNPFCRWTGPRCGGGYNEVKRPFVVKSFHIAGL